MPNSIPAIVKSGERHALEVLEAIAKTGPVSTTGMAADAAGYHYSLCSYAIKYLHERKLISYIRGSVSMTERGKIALAIYLGKQHRRRQQSWRKAA